MGKYNKWLWLGGLAGSALTLILVIIMSTATVAAPVVGAVYAWQRITGLFDDQEWKNAVQRVSTFRLDSDRENLLLYKPLYINGQKVPDDHEAHWTNYGKIERTIYRPPDGRTVYVYDIGREALVGDLYMLLACKECAYAVLYSIEAPPNPDGSGEPMTPEQVGAYYTPDRFGSDLLETGRLAITEKYALNQSVRYITVAINNKSPGDTYFVQMIAHPPEGSPRSNALWSSKPQFDKQYRAIYEERIKSALVISGTNAPPISPGYAVGEKPLAPGRLRQGVDSASFGYYSAWADGISSSSGLPVSTVFTNHVPIYPVVGTGTSATAGTGLPSDAQAGYRKVYLGWQLPSSLVGTGRIGEIGINWLSGYPYARAVRVPAATGGGSGATIAIPAPNPPGSARKWKLYLLDSTAAGDKALLDELFAFSDPTAAPTLRDSDPELPAERLLKDFDNTSGGGSGSSVTLELADDDKRDVLVFVFEESSFTPQAALTPDVLAGLTDPNTPLCCYWPGQLPGLPVDWLSPAEIYLHEKLPPLPTKWPKDGSSAGYRGPRGGAFDIRYGSITAERIEEIISKKPFRGILPGGYSDPNGTPTPNRLTGKAAFFIEMGQKYGINPAYALAFGLKETELGTTGYHVYNGETGVWGYNLYGMTLHSNDEGIWEGKGKCIAGVSGRFCAYTKWEDSIEEFFILLKAYANGDILKRQGQYEGQNPCPCVTIDHILYWYAPVWENDTALYIDQVKEWITSWGANGDSGGGGGGNPLPPGVIPAISQYDCAQYDEDNPCVVWKNDVCGVASLTMVASWTAGREVRIAELLRVGANNGVSTSTGTSSWNYLDELKGQYNFTWRKVTYGSSGEYLAGIKEFVGQGQPVIANVVGAPYYYGHFFLVVDYDAAEDSFTVHDPANVRQPGNPPGIVQRWSANTLQQYLAGRVGSYYPAIIVSPAGPPA
jgi:hypothetical protein